MNAGEEAAIIVGKVLENNSDTFGYNTATGQFGDLIA
ncbi:chaperonin GroEL [Bartonella sp. 114]|nr:chaperonin GroEL [Bartonella sp. 114]